MAGGLGGGGGGDESAPAAPAGPSNASDSRVKNKTGNKTKAGNAAVNIKVGSGNRSKNKGGGSSGGATDAASATLLTTAALGGIPLSAVMIALGAIVLLIVVALIFK